MSDRAARPALLLDLDGTLTDSVYQHALAWRKALELGGITLSVSGCYPAVMERKSSSGRARTACTRMRRICYCI